MTSGSVNKIPKSFAVQPLKSDEAAECRTTCGYCGLSWDDSKSTAWTPAPAGRCPFEYFHKDKQTVPLRDRQKTLEQLSGFLVAIRQEKGQHVFEFRQDGRSVKTYFTYPKAKAFAEGVRLGRQLPNTHEETIGVILG